MQYLKNVNFSLLYFFFFLAMLGGMQGLSFQQVRWFGHLVSSDSFVTPWTVAHQAPLSMAFPGQKYWSGLSFPSLGNLPNPGIKPASPALTGQGSFLTMCGTHAVVAWNLNHWEPPGKCPFPSLFRCRVITGSDNVLKLR